MEVHNIIQVDKVCVINQVEQTPQAHFASFLINGERVVYSVDRTGIDKIWITVKSKHVKKYMTYVDALFREMHSWSLQYTQDITGCYHRPCWSTDPITLSKVEQAYFNREAFAQDRTQFPSLPVAKLPSRVKNPYSNMNPKQRTSETAATSNAPTDTHNKRMKSQDPTVKTASSFPPKYTPYQSSTPEVQELVTMVKALTAELHTMRQEHTSHLQAHDQAIKKLSNQAEAYEKNYENVAHKLHTHENYISKELKDSIDKKLIEHSTQLESMVTEKINIVEGSIM